MKELTTSMHGEEEEEEAMASLSSGDDSQRADDEGADEQIKERKRSTTPATTTAVPSQPTTATASSPLILSSASFSAPSSSTTATSSAGPAGPPAPRPRLMIDRLVLENFKSYAGAREIGPFHKSFSSIVGPNGSGKSNVIDALLFVFGYRANQIRLKKLSELIHKSAAHPDIAQCSVSVHFQLIVDTPHGASDDSYAVLPQSAFTLTRSANRASTSTYYLDGRVVPYSTVSSLLKQHHVDLDNNRFLILQGEVEQIAMMKPKAAVEGESGMLEYLEDIVGSNKHVTQLQAMEKQLEAMAEQRQERVHRLKLVEKEREALAGPRDEGLAWMAKQQQAMAAKGQLLQMQHYECWLEGGRVRDDRALLEEEWKEDKAAMRATEDRLRALEADMDEAAKEHTAVEAELKRCKAEYAAAERKDIKYKEDIKHRRQKLKKLATKLHSIQKDIAALQQRTLDEQTRLPQLQRQLTALTADKERVSGEVSVMYERMKAVMEPFRAELEAKQRQLLPGRKKVNEQQALVDAVTNETAAIEERQTAVEGELQSLTQQLRGLHEEQRSKADEKKLISATVAGLVSSLTRLSTSLAGLQQDEAELNTRHSALVAASEDVRVSQAAAASSSSTALAGLLELKRKGQLPSLIGRLGDLAIIDAKYDVAVTTACGALNDIVVEHEEDARRAIEWLKREKRGRCKFIILDKMAKLAHEMQQPFEAVDGAQRLFDLLQLEAGRDAVRVAFWYGLRNTLVCDNMDDAMRVGFDRSKKRRVVTLDGKMIDSSGTMTGGGSAVSRGGMRSSWNTKLQQQRRGEQGEEVRGDRDIKAMETEVKDIEAQLATLSTQRKALAQQQTEQQSEKAKQETQLKRLERESEQLALQTKGLNDKLISLKAAAAGRDEDNRQLRALQVRRADSEKAVARARDECRGLEEDIAAIEKRIMERGGRVMQDKKAALAALSQQCDELQAEVVNIEANREGVDKRMNKWLKERTEAQAEEAATQQQVTELMEAQQQLEEDAMAMLEAYKAAQDAEKQKEERMAHVRAEHGRGQEELDGCKDKHQERQLRAEELEALRKDQEVRERVYKRKLRELLHAMKKEREEALAAGAIEEAKGEETEEEKMQVDHGEEQQPQSAEEEEADEAEQPIRRGRGGRRGAAAAKAKKSSTSTASAARSSPAAVLSQHDSEVSAEEIRLFRLLPLAQLPSNDRRALTATLATLEAQLSSLQPNPRAIAEYNTKDSEYRTRQTELNDLTARRADTQRAYESTRTQRLNEFMGGFTAIASRLKEMYQMLTLGGDAELELVDAVDPFAEGIAFSVRPPKKSWKNISNLSGGEKTLSSLALVFALHYFRPTPIYVMDEIDAALDFRNVSIVANYIKERTRDSAQFIIVSLRNNMFELADRLVGVYKVNDQTSSVTIDPASFTVPTGAEQAEGAKGTEVVNGVRPPRGPLKPIN